MKTARSHDSARAMALQSKIPWKAIKLNPSWITGPCEMGTENNQKRTMCMNSHLRLPLRASLEEYSAKSTAGVALGLTITASGGVRGWVLCLSSCYKVEN